MDDANSVYVGGLSYESNEDAVRKAFMEYGDVASVKIVYDRESGESRGFGFVTFVNSRSAQLAIRDMDGGQVDGRTIRVNEARKNLKGLGFRDRDHRDFRFRDMRERIRRRDSPPSRERMHHRTRSPPIPRHMSRSLTPMRISPPPARGSSPRNNGRSPHGRYHHSPEQQRKERSRSARSSISPQSSTGAPRKQEESVHKQTNNNFLMAKEEQEEEDAEVRTFREELDKARENQRGLEEKVASLQGVVEKADVTIAALKTKSLKLEESLANAQQLAAQRQFQLKRLQTSVFHFKLATERLTNSEKEMKALAALTSLEVDHDHPRELANGHAPAPAAADEEQQNHNTTQA